MPHIKCIRLVNVYFNNATQFYDDFIMKMGGRDTTYDLENGGGKSLLLQMLLQTVLPKSYLRKEKPVSLIFQGGRDRTSHSVAEWILEDGSTYKYLMTGFCARKRRGAAEPSPRDALPGEPSEEDENLRSGDIEHLNWCVFYNDNRNTGISSIPLVSGDAGRKTYAGFDDVRKYIQQMNQKGLPARVFDRIDEYQSFIAAHNIISAEWNIIRGINSGENSIESYFRQNTTSRKLIENQFIKIVEDVETLNRGDKSGDESLLLADTLIELRERLNEYIKLKSHMSEFERIKEYYGEFGRRNEELSQAYLRFEEGRRKAAVIKRLIDIKLKSLKDMQNDAQHRLKFNRDSRDEGIAMVRLLEAGLINLQKNRLSEKKRKLEGERDRLKALQDESDKRLNDLYTLEAYGEYRSDLKRRREIEKRLENLQSDADTLRNEYEAVGGKYRYHVDQQANENEKMLGDARRRKAELEKENKELLEQRIREENKKSILEKEAGELKAKESAFTERLNEAQTYFIGLGEMGAVLSPGQYLDSLKAEIDKAGKEINTVREKLDNLTEQKRGVELEEVRMEGDIRNNGELQTPLKAWLKEYDSKLAGLIEKARAYGRETVERYTDELELAMHKENLGKLEKEIEIARLRQKKQLSEEKGYYVPNEEILSLAELLGTKCEYVKTGIDWIANLKEDQREAVVAQTPYLGYSVIVDGVSFGKLRNNGLKIDFSSDYPVPVVNLESLRRGYGDDDAHAAVYYMCSFSGLLTSEERFIHYIRNAESIIAGLESEARAAEDRIAKMNADRMEAAAFLSQFSAEQVEKHREKLRELEQNAAALHQQMSGLKKEAERLQNEEHLLNSRIGELDEIHKNSMVKHDRLTAFIETSNELAELRKVLKIKRADLDDAVKKIHALLDTIDKNEQRVKLTDEEISGLQRRQYEIGSRLEKLAGLEPVVNDLPPSQLEAEYAALEAHVSGQIAEESGLREDLGKTKDRIEKQRDKTMRDYGSDLEQLSCDEAAGRTFIIPDKETISAAKKENKDRQKNLAEASQKVQDAALKESAEEGRLEQILRGMPEDSAGRLPQYETPEQYNFEKDYYRQLVASYEEGVGAVTEEINGIEGDIIKYERQSEDFDAFMEREKISDDVSAYDGTAEAIIEIEDYRAFEKSYRNLYDEVERQFSRWEDRMKAVQAEAAGFIIREPLEELEKISRPGSYAQCRIRSDAFKEYLLNIDEQMQKISDDIQQLESYQHNFTQRCVQRAELILGHLKKLEALSRIEIYGRRINMIELKLNEYEKNEKQLRMKNHIEGIIREINEEGAADRKRVAALLSTKELLAKIADMDKAVVRLYKVESIPENSRYYRWETAIGSEGQNNSLYFIFAACLISFIRMLSITNTAARTKKVIIADNPFGATSAVYLWDPMFRIMKQNDIQLIAPGHRIPREITSRFGVSYLLNQDILQDGRIRVVVRDVRAEEDEEVITWLDPEQLTIF